MLMQDRREFPRKRVALSLEGRSNNATLNVSSGGRVRLEVEDLSLGGLSASVDQPLVKGSRMAVFFPPQRPCLGALASGKVIRCVRAEKGYRVSLEFDRFPSIRGRLPYTHQALAAECK